jgi:LysM repeat protein
MPAVRQTAIALVYGIVSLILVTGSLVLALAQGKEPSALSSTFTPLPSSTATLRPSPTAAQAETATSAQDITSSATPPPAPSTQAAGAATTAASSVTPKANCGAPYGWTRAYVVQPGDTLFRIAAMYGIGVDDLRRANCRSGTVIFAGERLWVPYVRPVATELTIIPTFPTPTEPATATDVTPDP